MGLESTLLPNDPTRFDTALSDGKVMGWIEGIVINDQDPLKLGRVQVECPTIAENVVLPNGSDGWVPVVTTFVNNASPGGTHHPLPIGSQVVLLGRLGDPARMIVIGSMPSVVDRPFPEHDRSQGLTGTVTTGGVIEVNDDTVASQVIARPNGHVNKITGEGDHIIQTLEHGRLELMHDGNASVSNDEAFTSHTPDGTVIQQNSAGAISILEENGNVTTQSADGSRLQLTGLQGKLEGPLSAMSSSIGTLQQSVSGFISEGQDALAGVQQLAGELGVDGDINGFLAQAQGKLDSLQTGINGHFEDGLKAIADLKEFSAEDFGAVLGPQAEKLMEYAPLLGELDQISGFGAGDAIAQAVSDLGIEISGSIDDLASSLESFRFDPDLQVQRLIEEVMPQDFDKYKNIMGLGIHKVLPLLTELSDSSTLPIVDPEGIDPNLTGGLFEQEQERDRVIEERIRTFRVSLPAHVGNVLSDEQIEAFITGGYENPMEQFLGEVAMGMVSDVSETMNNSQETIAEIGAVHGLSRAIASGDNAQIESAMAQMPPSLFVPDPDGDPVAQALESAMQRSAEMLAERLAPTMETIAEKVGQLADAIPDGLRGTLVQANQAIATMETMLGPAGPMASVIQGTMTAQLTSGATSVYAQPSSAGVASPWGGFGFGSGGGSFFSQAKMAMQVAQSGSKSAGFIMDPEGGASLSSFNDRFAARDDERFLDVNETARISVDDGVILIESKGAGVVNHSIEVSSNGVYIDGHPLRFYDEDIQALRSRIDAIEAAAAAAAAASPAPSPSP